MRNSNTIGVDLAKNVIQVSVVTPANKELSNKELSRNKFAEFLAKQQSLLSNAIPCSGETNYITP
jgi:transposase